ncbi:hypothetical protein [Agromyces sp. Leaf222]|uniref:hypothetical protein n=1 Tax=Agromyces sp. Leaf222 TaxID=1735688 RepID=UPI0006F76DD9|nr:hypothetical protein [Agromyces sp. Leaf222]KQM83794.1 hypothetical protein ASE68_11760 [Agromyces sp. Leaf222]
MTDQRSILDTLHEATHRIPGVSAHETRPTGHQGGTRHGRARISRASQSATAEKRSANPTRNHTPARPPRVLVAWQRWIAAFFGREV